MDHLQWERAKVHIERLESFSFFLLKILQLTGIVQCNALSPL